jgi:hypothetical protein
MYTTDRDHSPEVDDVEGLAAAVTNKQTKGIRQKAVLLEKR